MSWLSKILGYVPAKERAGISLGKAPAWEISAPKDRAAFLRAIGVLVPSESVLYLEGGSPTQEIRAYLAERFPARITRVQLGTFWPRPEVFHMSITPENLEGLAEIAERHAFPEIAIHVHVYKDTEILLEWHDAGYHYPLFVSKKISVERIREFCDRLGVEYRDATDDD